MKSQALRQKKIISLIFLQSSFQNQTVSERTLGPNLHQQVPFSQELPESALFISAGIGTSSKRPCFSPWDLYPIQLE